MHERVLGFDFGTKRIGVAVGNRLTAQASPVGALAAQNGVPDWTSLTKILQEWNPDALLVGIPLNIDGSEQAVTKAARKFANRLADRYSLPIFHVDERLTTKEARQRLFDAGGYKKLKSTQIDSIAAQIIVEQWLMSEER